MRTSEYNCEEENKKHFDAYWKDRGVEVKSEIKTFGAKDYGMLHCLRSDLVLTVPKVLPDGKITGRIFGHRSEIMPRGSRKFLLPERRG